MKVRLSPPMDFLTLAAISLALERSNSGRNNFLLRGRSLEQDQTRTFDQTLLLIDACLWDALKARIAQSPG